MQNITLAKKNREELQPKIIYFPGVCWVWKIFTNFITAPSKTATVFLPAGGGETRLGTVNSSAFYFLPDYTLELTEKDKKI